MSKLNLKKAKFLRVPVEVSIDTDDGVMEGAFVGRGRLLKKDQLKQALEDAHADVEQGKSPDADHAILPRLFDGFEGLVNTEGRELTTAEESIAEVRDGEWSAHLTPLAIRAYYQKVGETPQGNSRPSRKR